ncbi:MAG: [protein-PII] uridylyltransferase [Pseudomonadota bacterium]
MTLLPDASAAPDSEPGGAAGFEPPRHTDTGPICPANEIIDVSKLRAALTGYGANVSRGNVVSVLSDALRAGRNRIETEFKSSPRKARPLVASYALLTDGITATALWAAEALLHPSTTAALKADRLAMLAVGGYGRAEMAPYSDVDLLFLAPGKVTPRVETVVEETLYILWDLRLKVGHATRTVRECLRLGREDMTIRTSLLEMRLLAGDTALATELNDRLRSDLFSSTGKDFIEAKLQERAQRHRKQGGQRYMLEPNVKEGKGGLRDLQSLYWIAKYIHQVDRVEDLIRLGVFTADEYRAFIAAEDFLWAVRAHLHLINGRAMDQLTFDMQVEVAERMGFTDHGGRRAVEHFMQLYFRHATRVGELTRIFLTSLEAAHVKSEPPLKSLFRKRRKVKPGYMEKQGRLAIADADAFLADPLNLLRIFDEGLRTGLLIHPDAMRLVVANLGQIDDKMRRDPDAARIFLDLMLKHGNPERALRRMNELGVLSAFVPEFEPIVAMMQFNVYHSYTVDEHTIQVIKALAQIEHGELKEELPLATRILKNGVNREVLYVALLLHDIGKGRPEDHSILGARIARSVAPRLRLKPEECETVEWLVRYHLAMSDFAQKRDLSDPRTIRDFAKIVKTQKRLDLLTVLTVCDIRGVGPNTWNNWKAQLLRALYRETATVLEEGMEALNRDRRGDEAREALRAALPDWPKEDLQTEIERHYPPYWQGLPTEAHVVFAELLRGIAASDIRMDLTPDEAHDATRVCFAMADHPGLFSRMAGALALAGANVVDAGTYTSKDGYATALFWVQDAEGSPYEAERLPKLRNLILKTLAGEVVARQALTRRDKLKRREQDFRFPTTIMFDNEGSDIYTIIEVDTRDRPGLLHDLTRTLASANIYISSAVIATYGAQVVDSFYVKDMFGLKYHSEAKRASLERKLREAIAKGAARAHRSS